MRVALVLLMLLVLGACGTTPPETTIRYPLSVRPKDVSSASNNGAIFQPTNVAAKQGGNLFEDRRAKQIGDTLTVTLVESTTATRKSETTDERKANGNINIPAPVLLGQGRGIGATTWTPAASNKLEFKDNETNSNTVSGAITVTVIDVLANGNLLVAGEKQLAINNDTEYIRLAGVVNPSQISATNTIKSTQLADVQFESKNAQGIDKSQVSSLMARFFLTVLPF